MEKAGLESAGGGNCVAERAGASVGQLEEGTFMAGRPHGQVLKIQKALNSLLKSFRVLLWKACIRGSVRVLLWKVCINVPLHHSSVYSSAA